MVTNFATNASDAIWWSNFELITSDGLDEDDDDEVCNKESQTKLREEDAELDDFETYINLCESKPRNLWNSDNQFIVCCTLPVSKRKILVLDGKNK